IRKWIDDSDVFLLVLGGRYGSIRPGSKLSYIECEYRYAEETNKPLFAAVISGEYLEQKVRTVGSQVKEELNGVLLKSFREHVTSKICKFFRNFYELKLAIVQSLKHFEDKYLDGLVRAS